MNLTTVVNDMNLALTIGHDAEVFVTEGGKVSSVIGHLGGTKKEPLEVQLGAVQEDNVLAELNIHPASSRESFIGNTNVVMEELKRLLPDFEILVASSHRFTKRELYGFGEAAFEFGCEPDYNAWTQEKNPRPDDNSSLRTAGGHIHFGFGSEEEVTVANQVDTIKMADYLLGVPSVLYDRDKQRRKLYGNAGAFRPKSYGVEYRTLSNFWLADDALMGWAYDTAVLCYEHRDELELLMKAVNPVEVVKAINTSNAKLAETLMKKMGSAVKWL